MMGFGATFAADTDTDRDTLTADTDRDTSTAAIEDDTAALSLSLAPDDSLPRAATVASPVGAASSRTQGRARNRGDGSAHGGDRYAENAALGGSSDAHEVGTPAAPSPDAAPTRRQRARTRTKTFEGREATGRKRRGTALFMRAGRAVINERFLSSVEVFSDLSDVVLKEIVAELIAREYAEGEIVLNEGDDGYEYFAIVSGEVVVTVSGVGEVATLHRGDCFGEVALIHSCKRTATVSAKAKLSVLTLTRENFLKHVSPSRAAVEAKSETYTFNRLNDRSSDPAKMTKGELVALREDCQEFLLEEPTNAYFNQMMKDTEERLRAKEAAEKQNAELSMADWWNGEKRQRDTGAPAASLAKRAGRANGLQRFVSMDSKPKGLQRFSSMDSRPSAGHKLQRFKAMG